jgi:putative Holliday junction resolvase
MKYMGIDYGTKRVGIALSDDSGSLARPVAVLKNTGALLDEVQEIINQEGVGAVVVGNSDGNKIQRDIDEFIGQLTLTTFLPIEQMNESFSSVEAHGKMGKEQTSARMNKAPGKPNDLDARAAAVILQRYLDKVSRKA